MNKFKLTTTGQQFYDESYNLYFDENGDEKTDFDYHEIPVEHQNIFDMNMYIDECYIPNEFETIEQFAETVYDEGGEYDKTKINKDAAVELILNKINNMIKSGYLEIVNL